MLKKRCKWCGKEFEPHCATHILCSYDCSHKYNHQKAVISRKIKLIGREFNFDVENKDKIINAKLMIFKDGNVLRCPCDANNPDRYCGSAQCIADVINNGHCHCNLFHKKKGLTS